MAKEKTLCPGIKKDGTPCKNTALDKYKGLCHTHYQIKTGGKLPSQHRKKIDRGAATRMLKKFGLQAHQIREMKKTFPELEQINLNETSLADTLDIISKCMTLRLLVQPDPKAVEAVIAISDFLERQPKKNGAVKVPDKEFSLWS